MAWNTYCAEFKAKIVIEVLQEARSQEMIATANENCVHAL